MRLIGEVPHQILFLNLNYDTYVEQAIRQFTSNAIRFEAFEDYVVPGRSMNLVKLHGSIDWFHPLPGPHGSWRDAVAAWSISNRSSPDLWEVHGKVSRSDRLRGVENRWMYPVLMAPLTEKTLKDASLPQSHLSWTHEFLETCEKFLIIGTNGFDDDLMELLDESVPPDSFPSIHVVGVDPAAGTLDNFTSNVTAFRSPTYLAPSIPPLSQNGFREFLSSEEFIAFAQHPGGR